MAKMPTSKKGKELVLDLDKWPKSWMGTNKDFEYGGKLLPFMEKFISHLMGQNLSRKTLKEYVDYLWLLGGKIIKDVSIYEEYKKDPLKKLTEAVEGGSCLLEGHENMTARELASLKKMCGEFEEFLQNLSTSKVGSSEKTTATLSTHPKFLALIERSRARQKSEGGVSSTEMRRRLRTELKRVH